MGGLTEFITARLDEDEAIAQAVANALARSHWESDGHHVFAPARPGRIELPITPGIDAELTNHIARFNPARALRDIEAKRRILDRHRNCGHGVGYCDDGGGGWELEDGTPVCSDKLDLAAIWSDHPDYQPDWAVADHG
jgi:hypothetical protein